MDRSKQKSAMTMAVVDIIKVLLTAAGLFIIFNDGGKAYEAYNSQFWPTTTGEITTSTIEAYGASQESRSYFSRIKYAYSVNPSANDDDRLINDRVRVYELPRSERRAVAAARLQPYPIGVSVTVYYNPDRPERSLLEPTFSSTYLILPAIGLVCLIVAISLWKFGRNR